MEHFFTCPYCWERISMILDCTEYTEYEVEYIEDCEVCCRPIMLHFRFDDQEQLITFDTQTIEGT